MKQIMGLMVCCVAFGWGTYGAAAEKKLVGRNSRHVKITSDEVKAARSADSIKSRVSIKSDSKKAKVRKYALVKAKKELESKKTSGHGKLSHRSKKEEDSKEQIFKSIPMKDVPMAVGMSRDISHIWSQGMTRADLIKQLQNNEQSAMKMFQKSYQVPSELWNLWIESSEQYKKDLKEAYTKPHVSYRHDTECKELLDLTTQTLEKNGINPKFVSILVQDLNTTAGLSVQAQSHSPACKFVPQYQEDSKTGLNRVIGLKLEEVTEPADIVFDEKCVKNLEKKGFSKVIEHFLVGHEVTHFTAYHHAIEKFMETILQNNNYKGSSEDKINLRILRLCQEETAEFMPALKEYSVAYIMKEGYRILVDKDVLGRSPIHPTPLTCLRMLTIINELWEQEIPADKRARIIDKLKEVKTIYVDGGHCTRTGVPEFAKNLQPATIAGNLDSEVMGPGLDMRTFFATMSEFPV